MVQRVDQGVEIVIYKLWSVVCTRFPVFMFLSAMFAWLQ
jgi:hypothetical protein